MRADTSGDEHRSNRLGRGARDRADALPAGGRGPRLGGKLLQIALAAAPVATPATPLRAQDSTRTPRDTIPRRDSIARDTIVRDTIPRDTVVRDTVVRDTVV